MELKSEYIRYPEEDIYERVTKLEKKNKKQTIFNIIVSILTFISLVFATINQVTDFYKEHLAFPNNSQIDRFMNEYSEAYSSLINNFLKDDYDTKILDKYIVSDEYKIVIEDNIKRDIKNGAYKDSYDYKLEFGDATYSYDGTEHKVFINGLVTTTYIKGTNIEIDRSPNDAERREFSLFIDKKNKEIKIKNKIGQEKIR